MRYHLLPVMLTIMFLTVVPIQAFDDPSPLSRKPDPVLDLAASVDAPTWSVGDYWNYTTSFSYSTTIIVPITIPFKGWINMSVSALFLESTPNRDPVYILDARGNITGHTTIPIYGDVWIYVSINGYYWQKMQDLAVYRMVMNATVSGTEDSLNGFYPFGYEFYPALEEYDFPLMIDDSWHVRTTASIPFSPGAPGTEMDSQFSCGSPANKTVPVGTYLAYPISIDGTPSLQYNGTVGNCISRQMVIDLSGIALDVPLQLKEFGRAQMPALTLRIKDPQPIQAGANFTLEGTYGGFGVLSIFLPGSTLVYSGAVMPGPFNVTITAPWQTDDTPTSIDHASLGILSVVLGGPNTYSVRTVTTRATDIMINDTMVRTTPMGDGRIDDPVLVNVTVSNPSNFGCGPYYVKLVFSDPLIAQMNEGPFWIESGSSISFEVTVVPSEVGDHSVTVFLDPAGLVPEYNETNNNGSARFSVKPWSDIVWDSDPGQFNVTIEEGTNATFAATAKREGSPLTGRWYLDDTLVGGGNSFRFNANYLGSNSSLGSPFEVRYVLDPSQTFEGEKDRIGWGLKVLNVDRAPIITDVDPTPGPITLTEGESSTFIASGMDPDSDPVELTWVLDGVECGSGGQWTFVSEFVGENSSSGSPFNLTLTLTGGAFSIVRYWEIEVNNVDRAFTIAFDPDVSNFTLKSGENKTLWANVTDPDGDDPTVRWSYLGKSVNATYSLNLVADQLGLGANATFIVNISVGSGEFSANRSWLVRYIEVPNIIPPEKIPPRNVTIVSPLAGYRYKTGETILLKANHTENRKTTFVWIVGGKTFIGQTAEVNGLMPGNYNVTLNASVAYPAQAWVINTVRFTVVDQEIRSNEGGEEDMTFVYVLGAIALVLVVFVAVSLYSLSRWRKAQAKIPDFEVTEVWEE